MIRRDAGDNWFLIAQPAHAALAGQFAQHWGNGLFAPPEPRAEVILAANAHDNGWMEWEDSPKVDRQGVPYNFSEMPIPDHLSIWRLGTARMLERNPYAALLVSLHGADLYSYGLDAKRDSPEARELVADFLRDQAAFQTRLRQELREHPRYAQWASEEAIRLNFRLLQVWDWLSLVLCCRPVARQVIERVPARPGGQHASLRLLPQPNGSLLIRPYPFRVSPLAVWVEGKTIPARPYEIEELREHLQAASPERMAFHIAGDQKDVR